MAKEVLLWVMKCEGLSPSMWLFVMEEVNEMNVHAIRFPLKASVFSLIAQMRIRLLSLVRCTWVEKRQLEDYAHICRVNYSSLSPLQTEMSFFISRIRTKPLRCNAIGKRVFLGSWTYQDVTQ